MTKLAIDLFAQQIFINGQSAGDTEVNKKTKESLLSWCFSSSGGDQTVNKMSMNVTGRLHTDMG